MESPFFPRTANNGLPSDIHSLILKELNVKDLSKLRATSNMIMNDDELKKMQELDVQRAEVLGSVFHIPKHNIPEVLLELKTYLEGVLEEFSNKNLGEIEVLTKSFTLKLDNESDQLFAKQHKELIFLSNIQDDRERANSRSNVNYKILLIVNNIKSRLVEQEYLIAVLRQYPHNNLSMSLLNQAHEQKVRACFTDYSQFASLFFWDLKHCPKQQEYFKFTHDQEDAMALLSSHPPQMQSYLKECHEKDYILLYNWMKSKIIGTKHEKRDLDLLDKKFAPDVEIKNCFVQHLGWHKLKCKI